jgi:hypothetical protein
MDDNPYQSPQAEPDKIDPTEPSWAQGAVQVVIYTVAIAAIGMGMLWAWEGGVVPKAIVLGVVMAALFYTWWFERRKKKD